MDILNSSVKSEVVMKSLTKYLLATDGKTPEQIRKWFSRLPEDEQRELQVAYLILAKTSVQVTESHQAPSLDDYDCEGDCPLLCSLLSEYRQAVGNTLPAESLLMSHIKDCTLCQTEWRKHWE